MGSVREVSVMSRYIDKDKVLKIVNDMTECEDDYERITEWVHNMPAIDIVRCKECKHWLNHKYADCDQNDFVYYCAVHKVSFSGKDFCSYGEREGE